MDLRSRRQAPPGSAGWNASASAAQSLEIEMEEPVMRLPSVYVPTEARHARDGKPSAPMRVPGIVRTNRFPVTQPMLDSEIMPAILPRRSRFAGVKVAEARE